MLPAGTLRGALERRRGNRGPDRNAKLAAAYENEWKRLPVTNRPKTYIFAVGDDANLPLFKLLARNDGVSKACCRQSRSIQTDFFSFQDWAQPVGQLD